jgi:predicted nucleic acid-binding protein
LKSQQEKTIVDVRQLSYIVMMLICDSSTLILLAKVELLDYLLDDYPGTIAVPEAVEHECLVPPLRPDGILIRERIRAHHIVVKVLQDAATANRLIKDFNLGVGEAEALALALEQRADLVAIDDRNGIRACKLLQFKFTTAIGILIHLRERGRLTIDDANRGLEWLAIYGRYHCTILEDAQSRLDKDI